MKWKLSQRIFLILPFLKGALHYCEGGIFSTFKILRLEYSPCRSFVIDTCGRPTLKKEELVRSNSYSFVSQKFCIFGFALLAGVLFCTPLTPLHAQLMTAIPDALEIEVSPSRPGPNTLVSVTVKNYSTDLDRATIAWFLNGKQMQKAIGLNRFEFRTGSLGTPSSIDIVIVTVSGRTIRKNIPIRPGEVDLVWETSGYTPPFYKGRSPYVNQGFVTVVAIPNLLGVNGKKLSAKNLVYKWSMDGVVQGSDSGYGKDSFSFLGTLLPKATEISVEVSSMADGTRASADLELDPERPSILVYQDDPIYGVLYNKALLDTFTLSNDEATFVAVPYYFSGKTPAVTHLDYLWSMNGADISGVAKKNRVTLRRSGQAEAGSVGVSVGIENSRNILQNAGYDFSISFDAKSKEVAF